MQLLDRPAPGSTSADLFCQIMVSLNITGNSFIGKFRSDGQIVQLGVLDSNRVQVELRGRRVVYTVSDTAGRQSEHGPEDILHIKGMCSDGLRGLSPVTQCRLALSLSSNLQEHARQFFEHGSQPSGILTTESQNHDAVRDLADGWRIRHGGASNMHKVAVLSGGVTFTPIAFNAEDSQFLQQRELSAREVARIFRVPPWMIGAPVTDSLTYSNSLEQNRSFLTHSLRPWLTRIERAFTADSDLCAGGLYLQFDLDGLLRADAGTRAQVYTAALNPETGWMTRAEVRALEDLPPEGAPNDSQSA